MPDIEIGPAPPLQTDIDFWICNQTTGGSLQVSHSLNGSDIIRIDRRLGKMGYL